LLRAAAELGSLLLEKKHDGRGSNSITVQSRRFGLTAGIHGMKELEARDRDGYVLCFREEFKEPAG